LSLSKPIKRGLLVLLSGLLLSTGIWVAGIDKVVNDLSQFPPWILAGMLMIFALNLVLVSFRLGMLLSYFGVKVPFGVTANASIQGHFASLFFISLFGQVAGRQSVLRHYGTQPVFIAALTAIERVILFLVSASLGLIGAAWIFDGLQISEFLNRTPLTQMFFVAGLALAASLWFGRTEFTKLLVRGIQSKRNYSQLAEAASITLLGQSLVLGAFVLAGYGLVPQIGFWNLLAAAAVTSFAASLPISVNGWGVREIAAVFAFGAVGIPASAALSISILVGLSSTAVVLATFLYVLKNPVKKKHNPYQREESPSPFQSKMAAWGLSIAVAIFILFQLHVPLQGGVINLNLADPFAVLALAAVTTQYFFTRVPPRWSVPRFNLILIVVSLLLLFAFLNGIQVIGVTQWALAGRLMGWIVLLGYLSIGILTVSYLGKLGVWRFVETLIATSVVIILFHAIMRYLAFSGWIESDAMALNFEGFSGNRNAFAFQLLSCSLLLLTYTAKQKSQRPVEFAILRYEIRREGVYAILHGVILAGLVFTGSRAGMLTGFLLVLFTGITNFSDRRILLKSIFYGCLVWMFFALFLPWLSQQFLVEETNARFAVQSILSQDSSNMERWETIRHGFEMWKASPWIGAGLGVFIETSSQWLKEPNVIHSTPIWILAEFGLCGAAILIAIFFWILVITIQNGLNKPANRAAVMLLGVFVIFGLVHEIFYQRIFWLVLGLCLAMPYRDRLPKKLPKILPHS